MTLSAFEIARIEKTMNDFIETLRPPAHIRDRLDFIYRLTDQSIEILEVRPLWTNPKEKTEQPVAKATFTKNQGIWKVYWHRADGKWHRYEPNAEVKTLNQFLSVIKKDEYGCFFG
jgi:hypothetical protein